MPAFPGFVVICLWAAHAIVWASLEISAAADAEEAAAAADEAEAAGDGDGDSDNGVKRAAKKLGGEHGGRRGGRIGTGELARRCIVANKNVLKVAAVLVFLTAGAAGARMMSTRR